MTTDIKQQIAGAIEAQIAQGWSGNKLAAKAGISPATLSHMRQGKWDLIKDDMWRKVAAAIGFDMHQWVPAETRNFKIIQDTLAVAQTQSISAALSHNAGSGKSFATQHFAKNNPNTYYVNCAEHFTKKLFLEKLCVAMGLSTDGLRTLDMIERIIEHALSQAKPLIILDEADKLNDRVLMFFIELYNRLNGKCGMMICGAPFLQKRINRGATRDKMGFREIYSRIGKRFITLDRVSYKDIEKICVANGVEDPIEIKEVYNEAEDADFDLRRVERTIKVIKLRTNQEAA